MFLPRFAVVIAEADNSLKPVLTQLYHTYLVSIMERDLGWYLATELMTTETGQKVNSGKS